MECHRQIFFHFGPIFALLPHQKPHKSKFWKNEINDDVKFLRYGAWRTDFFVIFYQNGKNAWRYHHFTQMYQKSWSYATLFLRYNVYRMFFFSNLDYFLPFYTPKPPLPPPAPANDPKNQKFLKIWKKPLEISSFDTRVPKIMITWCTVPEIWFGRIAGQTDGQTDGKSDI